MIITNLITKLKRIWKKGKELEYNVWKKKTLSDTKFKNKSLIGMGLRLLHYNQNLEKSNKVDKNCFVEIKI